MAQQIVALGGGGFSMEPDNLVLDRYILDLTGKENPGVCFLPQASAESYQYVAQYYKAFTDLGARPTWLSLFGSLPENYAQTILEQDVVYVGGGNTRSMLALWREWQIDVILKQALENGTVLAGISAGAICWFEQCVTDSVFPLGTVEGLGFIRGCGCPHYDGEAERRPTVHKMVAEGSILPCTALDDYAAAHFIDGDLHRVVTSREDAGAYIVSHSDDGVVETPLETQYITLDSMP